MALPDITFVSYDADAIKQSLRQVYESTTHKSIADGDPTALFLDSLAAYIVNIYAVIDYTGQQNLLQYARKLYLDHLGELTGTERLTNTYASTTLRFSIPIAYNFAVDIPRYTRATTADSSIYFQTQDEARIAAGSTSVDVIARAMTAGVDGNNLAVGQINVLVDPIPYFPAVSNLTVSSGGGEVESDEEYYQRIKLSPESYSVAGPEGAYRYWARTADPRIISASAISTDPGDVLATVETILTGAGVAQGVIDNVTAEISGLGRVRVYVLLRDGELPDSEVNSAVEAVLADNVRPLTDWVTVETPEPVIYDIDVKFGWFYD